MQIIIPIILHIIMSITYLFFILRIFLILPYNIYVIPLLYLIVNVFIGRKLKHKSDSTYVKTYVTVTYIMSVLIFIFLILIDASFHR